MSTSLAPIAGNKKSRAAIVKKQGANGLDREAVVKAINESGLLTYRVRNVRINDYLKSLLKLAQFLTRTTLNRDAIDEIKSEIAGQIHAHVERLKQCGRHDELKRQAKKFRFCCRQRQDHGAQFYVAGNDHGAARRRRQSVSGSFVCGSEDGRGSHQTQRPGRKHGLAEYAKKNPGVGRIQLIREVKSAGRKRFRRLDMSKSEIRERVSRAEGNIELDHIFDDCGD